MTLAPDLLAELLTVLPERSGDTRRCEQVGCRRRHHAQGRCREHYLARRTPYPARGPHWAERPFEWDMVHHAVRRNLPPGLLTREEAHCVVWILTQNRNSAAFIAARLHMTPRTVVRWRVAWKRALAEENR